MSATMPVTADTPATQDATQRDSARLKAISTIFGDRFVKSFASPILFLENQELRSPVAIRFFRKDFEYLSKQLYLEYQYRSWKGFNPEVLTRYTDLITKKLEAIKTLMGNNVNRMAKLLEQQGYKLDGSLWPTSHKLPQLPIIAAHARSYFELLCLLDKVYLLAGTANLFGVLDSAQRAEAEFICKKAVRAFRSVLQTEVVRLYREADRVVKEQNSTGQVDPQMAALVAEQGQQIKAFEADTKGDGQHDTGMDLAGQDAGQVIDDAAAASTAAASARKRTPTRKGVGEATGAPTEAGAAAGS